MVFPAKRDWCLNTVLHALALIVCGGVLSRGLGDLVDYPSVFRLIQIGMWSAYAIYFLVRFFWARYEITETELIVREGLGRLTISLERIFEIPPTRGGFIGAGWSHDALKVRFIREKTASDSVIISPRYKAGFLAELAARSPRLQPCGEGLKTGDPAPVCSRDA
jgi:hypothetical protein